MVFDWFFRKILFNYPPRPVHEIRLRGLTELCKLQSHQISYQRCFVDAGGMLCVHRWRLSFCVPCYKHVVCFVNEMAIFINETFRLLSRDVFQRVLSAADMPVHFSHYRREEKLFIKQNTLFFKHTCRLLSLFVYVRLSLWEWRTLFHLSITIATS